MRFVTCVTCVALVAFSVVTTGAPLNSGVYGPKPQYDLGDASGLFEKFIEDYNKTYKDAEDKKVHYEAFVKSLKLINRLNSDPNQGSATFGINKFTDYTEAERQKMYGLISPKSTDSP